MASAWGAAHSVRKDHGLRPLEDRAFMRPTADASAQPNLARASARPSTASMVVAHEQTNLTEPSSKR